MSGKGSGLRRPNNFADKKKVEINKAMLYGTQSEKIYACEWLINNGTDKEKFYAIERLEELKTM